eukprot:3794502-Rhodomonas_salina.5
MSSYCALGSGVSRKKLDACQSRRCLRHSSTATVPCCATHEAARSHPACSCPLASQTRPEDPLLVQTRPEDPLLVCIVWLVERDGLQISHLTPHASHLRWQICVVTRHAGCACAVTRTLWRQGLSWRMMGGLGR